MTKFDQVLSNDELLEVFVSKKGSSDYNALDVMRWTQEAVLAKLHEQEPVATILVDAVSGINIAYHQFQGLYDGMKLYAHPMPCVSQMSNKTACVSESGESDRQLARDQPCGCVVCYCKNQDQCQGCGAKSCGTHEVGEMPNPFYVDHIPDGGKMVEADHSPDASNMIWCACGDGFEPDTFGAGFISARGQCQGCDAEDRSSVLAESRAKIIAAANWLGDSRIMAIRGTATDKDVEEAYKALELRIAAELAITQESASEAPEGWQLVPKEPARAMVDQMQIQEEAGFYEMYYAALAAAPKFGDKQ